MASPPPAIDLERVRLIVFDLDGTLYADTRPFDHYAALLREHVPPRNREAYDRDYAAALAGRHPLAIGRLYDNDADLILAADRHLRITGGWHWGGTPVPVAELARRYPEPVRPDREHIVTVGDGWWLQPPCARHHGAPFTQEPFLATRRHMLAPAFRIRRLRGLRPALARLRAAGKRLAVISNSPDGDVQVVVHKLGLDGLFDHIFPEAGKPVGAAAAYQKVAAACGAAGDAVLAVGDNYINDIAPAEALGYQTLLIGSAAPAGYPGPRVDSLSPGLLRTWR